MDACLECGSRDLVPSPAKVTIGPHGEPLGKPIAALRCAWCGRMYPAGSDRPTVRKINVDDTLPPE